MLSRNIKIQHFLLQQNDDDGVVGDDVAVNDDNEHGWSLKLCDTAVVAILWNCIAPTILILIIIITVLRNALQNKMENFQVDDY